MRQSQHILVLYDQKYSHREVPGSTSGDYRLSYCAAGNRGKDIVNAPEQGFDWLLVDGTLIGGNQKDFFQALRAIDIFCSRKRHGHAASCCIEWTDGGVLQLQCCMQPATSTETTQEKVEAPADGFVFEYHAPMKHTG